MALTERQQEIKDLLEQGKKAPEIAKALKISTNGVYQHLRRMRDGAKTTGSRGRGGRRRSTGRQSRVNRQPRPAPVAAPADEFAVTPLQAVRIRRDSIKAAVRASETEVTAARKALERAEASHTKLTDRHDAELATLEAAESALTANSKRRPTRKSSGRKKRSQVTSSNGTQAAKGGKGTGRHLEPVA